MRESFESRGGWWVLAQFVMLPAMVGLMLAARRLGWESPWPTTAQFAGVFLGLALVLAAAVLFVTAVARLGSNLTPFPKPLKDSSLVVSGAYGLVRHPIYTSIIWAMCGAAF